MSGTPLVTHEDRLRGWAELRAEIVNTSVQGARVQVANDMRQDTPISRGVKGLAA